MTSAGRLQHRRVTAPVATAQWVALVLGLIAAEPRLDPPSWATALGLVAGVAVVIVRTVHPGDPAGPNGPSEALMEVAALTVAATLSGGWASPLVLVVAVSLGGAGFALGPWLGAATAAFVSLALTSASAFDQEVSAGDALRVGTGLGGSAVLIALLGSWARRISAESAQRQSQALDRLGRLAEANALLFSLHRVAQTLPASLDLDEVLDSSIIQLRDLLVFDSLTVLLRSETTEGDLSGSEWVPVRRTGNRAQTTIRTAELPPPLTRASTSDEVVSVVGLNGPGGPGLAGGSTSGLYAALRARGTLIGLLAIESTDPAAYDDRAIELLSGLVEPLALAIDNARWFMRLRRVGADEERSRIARDLHDRIGQSLAYLGFELDRTIRNAERGDDVSPELTALRSELRGTQAEIRETLYDLRTEVTPERTAERTLNELLERVASRSAVDVDLVVEERHRLPPLQERELFRIAKEAVLNAERHARATRIEVRWTTDGRRALLVVSDDGIGIDDGAGRTDSYGIAGMRERADGLGAVLELGPRSGGGTTVRVVLAPR